MVHWNAASCDRYLPMSGSSRARAKFVQIFAHAQRNFLRVQDFACETRGTMFGTASAFDAGVCLQRDQFGDVFAGVEAEVFIAHQRRNLAELVALEEHRDRAQHQMQMFGLWGSAEGTPGALRCAPTTATCFLPIRDAGREIGDHQKKNQERDEARFVRDLPQPVRPDDEASECKSPVIPRRHATANTAANPK